MYFCVYCVPQNGETAAVCVRRDNDLFVIRISAEDTINQYSVAKERKKNNRRTRGRWWKSKNVDGDFIKRRLGLLKGS